MTFTCSSEFSPGRNGSPGQTVLVLSGEMDIHTSAEFSLVALEAMDRWGSDVTVDVSALTFLDCSGVSLLLMARREAVARGGSVVLVGASGRVLKLLRLTSVESLFAEPKDVVLPSHHASSAAISG